MTKLEDTLREMLARRAESVTQRRESVDPRIVSVPPSSRSPWLYGAVAASVAALAIGLTVTTTHRSNDGIDSGDTSGQVSPVEEAAAGTALDAPPSAEALGDVDDLGADEWVYPSVVPDGVAYAYPTRLAAPHPMRSILFVSDAELVGYVIEVHPAEADLSLSDPSSEPVDIDSRTDEELDGHMWEVASTEDGWLATLHLDSTSVRVSGPVAFDDSARTFIEGLVAIREADLPSPPLDFDGGDFVEVARYDSGNGLDAAIGVTESNEYFCIKFHGGIGGGGGGCGLGLFSDGVLSGVNTTMGPASDGDGVRVNVAGITSSDVALVEIEFVNGSVARTTPTDLSGRFEVGFWVAAANIAIDEDPDPPWNGVNTVLTEVRAYDASGALLATHNTAE